MFFFPFFDVACGTDAARVHVAASEGKGERQAAEFVGHTIEIGQFLSGGFRFPVAGTETDAPFPSP